MRKVLITAASALLLASISFPMSAYADEPQDDSTIETPAANDHDVDNLHTEIEILYKDNSWLLIPPTVMRMGQPRDPNIYVLPTIPTGSTSVTILESTKLEQVGLGGNSQDTTLNPYQHAAIPIDSVNISTATPADEFVEGAKVLAIALGVAALGLSTLTGVNTFQSRRRKLRYLKASEQ